MGFLVPGFWFQRPGLRSTGGASGGLPASKDERTLVPPALRMGLAERGRGKRLLALGAKHESIW